MTLVGNVLSWGSEAVSLTPAQVKIMRPLILRGEASQDFLALELEHDGLFDVKNQLTVQVSLLRSRLKPYHPPFEIKAAYGFGYYFHLTGDKVMPEELPIPEITQVSIRSQPALDTEALKPVRMAPRTNAFRAEVTDLMKKHGKNDSAAMLAVAAHVVGTALAVQNPKKTSPAHADKIIRVNVTAGLLASQNELLKPGKLGA
ncbi:hypothetical protein GGQ97_002293 [Sphingomonas kaistensis]|uniref:OmpR/PhoB-type domain-containing protein n=1 Tax=Sphingomonas kaistensis TaxID=298708 RepID=A0A7X6BHG3_9SPHN|nr:helix-turn-helix domain-containing protein [Sphingomonas kaistensis]NJC06500.1 hypothetical protein [Sphingomonas kaistensis]